MGIRTIRDIGAFRAFRSGLRKAFANYSNPNVILDVTDTWETKINALYEHKSQIGEPEKLAERMRERHTEDSTSENPRYEERFRRLLF